LLPERFINKKFVFIREWSENHSEIYRKSTILEKIEVQT
jgi:hypothetical protein